MDNAFPSLPAWHSFRLPLKDVQKTLFEHSLIAQKFKQACFFHNTLLELILMASSPYTYRATFKKKWQGVTVGVADGVR